MSTRKVYGKVNAWDEVRNRYYGRDVAAVVEVRPDSDSVYVDGRRSAYEVYQGRNGRWFVIPSSDGGQPHPVGSLENVNAGAGSAIDAAQAWLQGDVDERGGWFEDPRESDDYRAMRDEAGRRRREADKATRLR